MGGYFVTDSEWANELRRKLTALHYQMDFCSSYQLLGPEEGKKRLSETFRALETFADVEVVLAAVEAEKRWLNNLKGRLDPESVGATITRLDNELEEWEGNTADTFRGWLTGKDNDGNPGLKLALAYCYDRVIACWHAMDAYCKTIEAFRSDVRNAISTAEKAIQEQRELDDKLDLTVVSAAAAVGAAAVGGAAAALATGGLSLSATAAVGSALVAGKSSYAILDKDSKDVPEIIDELREGLLIILEKAQGQLSYTRDAFRIVSDHLVGRSLEQVRPRRPSVVTDDSFDPEQFSPTAPGETVDGISTDDLVKEPGQETENMPGNPGHVDRVED